jgi:hypothetical protein
MLDTKCAISLKYGCYMDHTRCYVQGKFCGPIWKMMVVIYIPWPFPTLLNWDTYSDIFLIDSTWRKKMVCFGKHISNNATKNRVLNTSLNEFHLFSQEFAFNEVCHFRVIVAVCDLLFTNLQLISIENKR